MASDGKFNDVFQSWYDQCQLAKLDERFLAALYHDIILKSKRFEIIGFQFYFFVLRTLHKIRDQVYHLVFNDWLVFKNIRFI